MVVQWVLPEKPIGHGRVQQYGQCHEPIGNEQQAQGTRQDFINETRDGFTRGWKGSVPQLGINPRNEAAPWVLHEPRRRNEE